MFEIYCAEGCSISFDSSFIPDMLFILSEANYSSLCSDDLCCSFSSMATIVLNSSLSKGTATAGDLGIVSSSKVPYKSLLI
jgi:hypothetical protein|tara:strand:+ start:152 stop:394 length:243 start_codon:yes stop_codon:yes gene_type:complete